MSAKSAIEWTDATWNPVTGCTKVSQGCKNCYAEREWPRLQHLPAYTGRAFTDVRCHPDRLDEPLRWRRPRKIFVCHNADLFHESVPDDFIVQMFIAMALADRHTFQILTKRPERMLRFLNNDEIQEEITYIEGENEDGISGYAYIPWPLPNVWLGVSVEDQETAEARIPLLLQTPAAVRWVSAEPLLSEINLRAIHLGDLYWLNALTSKVSIFHDGGMPAAPDYGLLNWIVAGGESGRNARPMHPDWPRALRNQCQAAGVPFFFKQYSAYCCEHTREARAALKARGRMLDGRMWDEYPAPC